MIFGSGRRAVSQSLVSFQLPLADGRSAQQLGDQQRLQRVVASGRLHGAAGAEKANSIGRDGRPLRGVAADGSTYHPADGHVGLLLPGDK